MSSDPALAPATASGRLNGYLLITELSLHVREPTGYRSLTAIDLIALRPPTAPGRAQLRLGPSVEECPIVTDIDPASTSTRPASMSSSVRSRAPKRPLPFQSSEVVKVWRRPMAEVRVAPGPPG